MSSQARFKEAYPFQNDVLALPVTDLDVASRWYTEHFGMPEVERLDQPVPTVILERDGTRIGFEHDRLLRTQVSTCTKNLASPRRVFGIHIVGMSSIGSFRSKFQHLRS